MKSDTNTQPTPLEAAFAAAGEQGMRGYLEGLFRKEPQHIARFVARFAQPSAGYLARAVQAELDEALCSHAEEDGFVTWRESIDFEREYLDAIAAYAEPALQRGDADAAFTLLEAVMGHFRALCVDDSNGFATSVMGACRGYWSRAFALLPPEQVPGRFNRLLALATELRDTAREGLFDWVAEEDIESFLVDEFADNPSYAYLVRELAEASLDMREQEIAEMSAQLQKKGDALSRPRIADCTAARWRHAFMRTMRAMGDPADAILACADPYIEHPDVALLAAEVLEEDGDAGRACALLERTRKTLRYPGRDKSKINARLLQMYRSSGMEEDEKALLRELLVTGSHTDPTAAELLRAYKGCWEPELWPDVRDELLSEMKPGVRLCECLMEEGLDEQLMAALPEAGLSCLERFEGYLVEAGHVDFVVRAWCKRGESDLAGSSERSGYFAGAQDLARAARFPGGEELAKEVADRMRRKYPRRSAMKDELRKAGL
ncbi:MAG: hypothetical protein ACI36Y_00225 [Coriobacteriales bacterium]